VINVLPTYRIRFLAAPSLIVILCAASCYPNPDDLREGAGGRRGSAGVSGGAGGYTGAAGHTSGTGGRGTGGMLGGGGGTGGHTIGTGGMLGGGGGAAGVTCTDPAYPLACPAANGVPASCWQTDTACSTIALCSGNYVACKTAGYMVYCAGNDCCQPPAVGGTCNIPDCGCGSGQICYPSSQATGLACYTTSNLPEGADCSTNFSGCASGFGCFGGVCKKYCLTDTDCTAVDGVRSCGQTSWGTTSTTITGVLVCGRVCDPVTPTAARTPLLSCPSGFGCDIDINNPRTGVTYCAKRTGSGTAHATCTTNLDCAAGYYCTTSDLCYKYCYSSTDCPSGSTCQFFTTPYYAGTRQIGGCSQ